MSRYIDKDALIENFGKLTVELWLDSVEEAEIVSLIGNAPSIDIVRCKECKYCVDAGAQRALVCDNSYIDMDIHPDDFCSYGERKEDE